MDAHADDTWFTELRFPRRIAIVRRDVTAQAQSFQKFITACGVPVQPSRLVRKSIRKIRPWYETRGRTAEALLLAFEDVLADPRTAAERIVAFVGQGDPETVAAVVVPRGPECYPGMLEAELVNRGGG